MSAITRSEAIAILKDALVVANVETLGELAEYCDAHNTTPSELVKAK